MQPQAPVLQVIAAVGLHPEQGLAGEVGRHLQRGAGSAQQARAADREHGLAEQRHRARRQQVDRAIADRDVDAVALEIGEGVAGGDANVDLGMGGDEGGQARDQPDPGEAGGGADHDRPGLAPFLERAAGAVDRRQRLGRRLLEGPALLGEHQGAVQAPEQRHAEPVFEGLDLPADRRLGQRDLVAGAGEAEVAGRGLERHQQLERRHVIGATAYVGHFWHAYGACEP